MAVAAGRENELKAQKRTVEVPGRLRCPIQTFVQPVEATSPAAAALTHTYVLCTDKEEHGANRQRIIRSAARARAEGWRCFELSIGHHPTWTMPQELASLLLELT